MKSGEVSGARPDFLSRRRAVAWSLAVPMARILLAMACRVRVSGLENFPCEGPVILAPNHISHFDPPVLSTVFPRPIDWIAMSELYGAGWSRRFFLALNAIPIRRGAPDRTALREAAKRLTSGRVVGIFPEGGLRDGEASVLAGAAPLRGAGLLARVSGAPVVPCAIVGTDRLYNWRAWFLPRRVPVWVRCAPPLPPLHDDAAFGAALSPAFQKLCKELVATEGVCARDLPRPPREHMAEKVISHRPRMDNIT
jgi:1-acyl-sn-glycerol-3-phosphate acyltransferase